MELSEKNSRVFMHAYAQMSVDKASQKYMCINTHKELYAYTFKVALCLRQKSSKQPCIKSCKVLITCVCNQDDILNLIGDRGRGVRETALA